MPEGEPVNLTFAIVMAAVGGLLALFLIIRLILEHRRKRALLAEAPDFERFDPDIQRYLRRTWLLAETWRRKLGRDATFVAVWGRAHAMAADLQEARDAEDESSAMVQQLVLVETELEEAIATARDESG